MFFNTLCAAQNDFKHYFDLSDLRGQILIATIIFVALIIAVNIAVYFAKRDYFQKINMISLALTFVYSVIITLVFFVKNIEDFEGLKVIMVVALTVTLAVAIALFVGFNKAYKSNLLSKKSFAISAIAITGVLLALALIFVIISIVKNSGSIEAMDPQAQTFIIAGIFILLTATIFFVSVSGKRENENNTLAIVYAAICIGISFALSYVRILKLPQGGSITFASLLPVAIYSYIFGVRRGLLCCFVYGLLQAIQDPFFVHPIQLLLDYPIAFIGFGLAGIFKKMKPILGFSLAFGIGLVIRYFAHAISGAVYFGSFGADYGIVSPWAWGFAYNSFVFADGLIAIVAGIALLSSKQMLMQIKTIRSKFRPKQKIEEASVVENTSENE